MAETLGWTGPVRPEAADMHVMKLSDTGRDPRDAALSWADITNVSTDSAGQVHWRISLAGKAPVGAGLDPAETVIAYGLVLETNGDGAADYVVGIDNDAPRRGDYRVWVTNLATGDTDEQLGPPYGFPVEFAHPDEHRPGDPPGPPQMVFTFLPGSAPLGVAAGRVYAWASVTQGDEVVAWDYAPDATWLGAEPTEVLGCTPSACPMPGPAFMPAGSRQLVVSVENTSEREALLFVAKDEGTMGALVGTAAPAMLPAGKTADVVFTVPPGQGWAIFANPTTDSGPLIVSPDVPEDASGRVPFTIMIVDGVPTVFFAPGTPSGWFGH